jgi:hypothetical protein
LRTENQKLGEEPKHDLNLSLSSKAEKALWNFLEVPEMVKSSSWLEVDKDGLRELQEGKPKSYLVRELVANAWDEDITFCNINTAYEKGVANISVEDDSPNGFKDLADSYTLFKHTSKRSNPNQRGRFNLGEKQVLSLCHDAKVESTKGTIIFNKDGTRSRSSKHTDKGTKVTVNVKMSRPDYEEIINSLGHYLSPKNILTKINGQTLEYKQPFKTTSATLQTELEEDGAFRKTQRKTEIEIHRISGDSYLYEMQIPVMKIDCQFSIDIQQKIPLNIDRETVSPAFLKTVFAEVLNATYNDITDEDSSENWIRQASGSERISGNAIAEVTRKRFGEKVLIGNPFDPTANDEAISNGYKVIQSKELSQEERQQLKSKAPIESTTAQFGGEWVHAKEIAPSAEQAKVASYAIRIHKRLNDIELEVRFVECPEDRTHMADYGNHTLTFNVSALPYDYFKDHLTTTDLILHEIGHEFGNHTEHRYHEALTRMAQKLLIIALNEPSFLTEV